MLLFYIIFGDRNPNYPSGELWAPIFHQTRAKVSLSSMQGVFAESLLRKQAWRNPKEGRVGSLHQNIFTRKVTDIAFTSDFCNNYSHPASPTSLCLTSPRPRPTRPRVPYLMSSSPSSRVPKSQVPTHASRCPSPLVPVPLLYTTEMSWFVAKAEAGIITKWSRQWSKAILEIKSEIGNHWRSCTSN